MLRTLTPRSARKYRERTEVSCCIKYFMFAFNVIFWVCFLNYVIVPRSYKYDFFCIISPLHVSVQVVYALVFIYLIASNVYHYQYQILNVCKTKY